MRRFARRLAASFSLFAATGAFAQLSIDPPNPTALDTVRLRYAHLGCTNADSAQVSQESNRITVSVDRGGVSPDCGTVAGFFEEYTLGRLPAGEYDASLVVAPPPGTLGPTEQLGPIHLSVARAGATGSLHPHDDYSDMWWNPREPGWALTVNQLREKLFMVWVAYDDAGEAAWLVVPGGSWSRDSANRLRFTGKIYRTQGTPWRLPFDPSATRLTQAGTASFTPLDASHGIFGYTVDGVSASKMVERFRF
ncbi:MAG TPA: hypothetical protein VLS49_12485 [Usitatibacter sp.]|nr:hypothetical protein [Usitatibacter sp.]